MEVLSPSTKPKNIINCESCGATIAYYSWEVKYEAVDCPWDDNIFYTRNYIKCPCCEHDITINEKVHMIDTSLHIIDSIKTAFQRIFKKNEKSA